MKIIREIGILFALCLIGQGISLVLPIPIPAGVCSMVILFFLLFFQVLKPEHILNLTTFLLANMAFFFIPASVSMMDYYDVVKGQLPILIFICLITTILTFAATAWTVQFVIRLQRKVRER